MKNVYVGTRVPIRVTVADDDGEQITPEAFTLWARRTDGVGGSIPLTGEVVDGTVLAKFKPPNAGSWIVAIEVTAPVETGGELAIPVLSLPRKPTAP